MATDMPTQPFDSVALAATKKRDQEEAAENLIGRTIGGCRLLSKLGAGGMGAVYKAEQLSLKRMVAIKVLHAAMAHPTTVERLKSEARVIAALSHPNIVQIYDIGTSGNLHYILMELVDGKNLRELTLGGLYEYPDRVIGILRQTLKGLAHAHERGVLHRDIKPDNLLVAHGDLVKIADFGLAKLMNVEMSLTATGIVMGTPQYLSPEAAYGKTPDPRSDIYSLGATFFHALAAVPPFQGENAMEILYRHIHDPLPPLRRFNPKVEPWVVAIVEKMLAKKPSSRFANCQEVLAALDRGGKSASASHVGESEEEEGSGPMEALEPSESMELLDIPESSPALFSSAITPVRRRRVSIPVLILLMLLAFIGSGVLAWLQSPKPRGAPPRPTPPPSATSTPVPMPTRPPLEFALEARTRELLDHVKNGRWQAVGYFFTPRNCQFPRYDNPQKIAKEMGRYLSLRDKAAIEGFELLEMSISPDAKTTAWSKVRMKLAGVDEPSVQSLSWTYQCGQWVLQEKSP